MQHPRGGVKGTVSVGRGLGEVERGSITLGKAAGCPISGAWDALSRWD